MTAPQWPKEAQVIIDGTAIPLKSWGAPQRSPGSMGGKSVHLNDASIYTAAGEHSSDLWRKAATGEQPPKAQPRP